MLSNTKCLVWNVRGLNDRAWRNVVRTLIQTHQPSLVCLQETKLSNICNATAIDILGCPFDYVYLPSVGVAGGILLGWRRDLWSVAHVDRGSFHLSARITATAPPILHWWLTVVYGPTQDAAKVQFLSELRRFRDGAQGPWLLCGDFNMIYRAQDKNNDRLDRRSMRRFRNFLHSLLLEEIPLSGRQFSWSSERDNPTLELLDRVFACSDWFAAFPNHALKPLSSDCSDHCPLCTC